MPNSWKQTVPGRNWTKSSPKRTGKKAFSRRKNPNTPFCLPDSPKNWHPRKKRQNGSNRMRNGSPGLVSRLNRAIEAQRKAAEKRQAKQRQATRKSAGKSRVAREETETARDVPYRPDTTSAFGRLRGRLKMPVSGTITARYGMKRADGPSWKGIFIKTSAGAPVHAVANGRVVFADFLRGFGNLIIIDHGNQYMTIYGNAQSFSRRVGDNVSARRYYCKCRQQR